MCFHNLHLADAGRMKNLRQNEQKTLGALQLDANEWPI
jgi:hypothetical protein